ncbi:MAG: hypothetical protein LCH46_12295 [Proteobacteria bacterium]|nr:hypothetical protein [Pseudomonadota bacterium]
MKRGLVAAAAALLSLSLWSASPAQAFCGGLEAWGSSSKPENASRLAENGIKKQVRSLRKKYGKRLVLQSLEMACVGGGVSIDANGNQKVGNARCTAKRAFCVNPR